MAGMRRYKIGEHPTYDRVFDAHKADSAILNPRGSAPNVYSINLGDAHALRAHLLETRGAKNHPSLEDGYYWKGESGNVQISHLKAAENVIEGIDLEFAKEKQTFINQGKHPPKRMSARLEEKMLKAEARLDVIQNEIETLERFLKTFTDQDEKISDGRVLQRGPKGAGKLTGGILSMIDGQTVKPDKDGVLRIADKRSQYHGMRTADYFEEIVKPWARETAKLQNAWREKIQNGELDGANPTKPRAKWPEKPTELKRRAA